VPKLPTKSGCETVEARLGVGLGVGLEVGLEVRLEVGLGVELEVGLEVELDLLLLTVVGICFPLVSSPIAPKKLTLSKSSFKSFRESLSKFLPPTVPFNNSSILLVAVLFGDDWAVVTVVVDDMANKLENSNSKGIQGSKH
jgi:hypothetical protein